MIPALAFALLAKPGLETRVSVRSTGTVSALLQELSERSGAKLSVGDRRGKEILIVSLNAVPVADAMTRIAWATFGRWEKAGDGYRLVNDAGSERDAQREYVRRVADIAKAEIERLRVRTLEKDLRPFEAPPAQSPPESSAVVLPATPEHRALVRALLAVKPESLIPTSPEGWCTFSNQPTPAQAPLGPASDEILRSYESDLVRAGRKSATDPVATRIVLDVDFTLQGGKATLSLFDDLGNPASTAQTLAVMEPAERPWLLPPASFLNSIPASDPVPLSPESKFFETPEGPGLFTPTKAHLDALPEVIERLKNPERYDPLGTYAADVWIGAATKTGRNLVANVDDRYFVPYWSGKPPLMRDALRQLWQATTQIEDSWLVVRPDLPNPRECHRIDRAALGRWARTQFTSDFSAFATTSAVAASADGANARWVLLDYGKWVKPHGLRVDLNFQWEAMCLYGSLPSSAQRDWLEGRPIAVSTLSETSRRALRAWTYPIYNPFAKLGELPTVRFPSGLPEHGWLRAELQTERGFYVLRPDKDGTLTPWWARLDDLAQNLNAYEQYNPAARSAMRFLEGPRVSVRLFPDFGDERHAYGVRLEGGYPDPASYVPWDSLPDETRQRIQEAQAKLRGG